MGSTDLTARVSPCTLSPYAQAVLPGHSTSLGLASRDLAGPLASPRTAPPHFPVCLTHKETSEDRPRAAQGTSVLGGFVPRGLCCQMCGY